MIPITKKKMYVCMPMCVADVENLSKNSLNSKIR